MQTRSRRFLARMGVGINLTAAVLGPAVPAAAEGFSPLPPVATMMQRMCEDHDAIFDARIALLETKIALKSEQRREWEAFVAAMRAAEQPLRDLCASPPSPPEFDDPGAVLDARERMITAHAAVLQAARAAVGRFREELAPDQQIRLVGALPFSLGEAGP